ncbi:tRNA-dihydrouridine synthase [Halorhabdus tiamatea]|uniref:tRNA dihydrouridine synthase B-like protein n=1 Tax=Halorhabdus tiamatea SARL4B TaxID=1033806 RepID=F7PP33_9EURY|nr:tRNA-dihydrouridine synthase [Halorhabdus tiamatea]CCQ32799.1 tRNA dihydrouridine synthase B-like protein [Halorhabdus tiamatea SARL4B]
MTGDGLFPFELRVAAASLSGESDAEWANVAAPYVGAAFLGGLAIDEPTRTAAREMVDERDREEFLPADPLAFADEQLEALADAPLVAGLNVRAASPAPIRDLAGVCADHDAICEINAHCRQDELCETGAGQALLCEPDRLAGQVEAAATTGASVSVKVRTEVAGVDLPAVARRIETAGADVIHVDAMDSEGVVADIVAATDLFVIANNGVRDRETVREYLAYGADAVSVGRPSDRPAVLERVKAATEAWFESDGTATTGATR